MNLRSFILEVVKKEVNKAEALGFASAEEQGVAFQTGQTVTFPFSRFTTKTGHFGSIFQQDIEPAGRYIIFDPLPEREVLPNQEKGVVTFRNPLVLRWSDDGMYGLTSWKARLTAYYKAKRRALSKKIMADGYDGIVTVDGANTSEIVDLTVFR